MWLCYLKKTTTRKLIESSFLVRTVGFLVACGSFSNGENYYLTRRVASV
jgi:hypothetical protein